MIVLGKGSNIYGARLTPKEKKALDIEIKKAMAEYLIKTNTEIDAMILWVLSEHLGFGEKRLRDFFDAFAPLVKELTKKYEMGADDEGWLCSYKLKEKGIDIEQWEKEAIDE